MPHRLLRVTAGAELADRVRPITRRSRRSVRQAVLARRRLLTAALAAAAVAAGLRVLAPEPPDTVAVPVAAADLAAGRQLSDGDVRLTRWPADLVPAGVAGQPIGSRLAAAVNRGEPITGARLLGPGLLLGQPPGTGSMAVRLDEPVAGLVRAGDRIDLIAGAPDDGPAASGSTSGITSSGAFVVARDLVVLALGPAGSSASQADGSGLLDAPAGLDDPDGGHVVLAVSTADALRIRAVADRRSLAVMVRPPP